MSNPEPADYKIFVFDYHLDYFLVFLVEVLVKTTFMSDPEHSAMKKIPLEGF